MRSVWGISPPSLEKGTDTYDRPRAASLESVGDDLRGRLVGHATRHGTCGERSDVPPGRGGRDTLRGRDARVH